MTAEFLQPDGDNGMVAWELPYNGIGHNPFDEFPHGAPEGSIACRWGDHPDIATDNVIDFAWSPIDADASLAAQEYLEVSGLERIETSEGVYLAVPNQEYIADEEGFGSSYLFTQDDVRWAMTKAELRYVKAPDDAG